MSRACTCQAQVLVDYLRRPCATLLLNEYCNRTFMYVRTFLVGEQQVLHLAGTST